MDNEQQRVVLETWLQAIIKGAIGKRGSTWKYKWNKDAEGIRCYHDDSYLDTQPLSWYREHYVSNYRDLELDTVVYIGGE